LLADLSHLLFKGIGKSFISLLRIPRRSCGGDEAGKKETCPPKADLFLSVPEEAPPFHGRGGFIFLALFCLILVNYPFYLRSYRNFWPVLTKKISLENYSISLSEGEFWSNLYQTAKFLNQKLKKEEKLFVMEGTPSLYILTDRMTIYSDFIFEQQFFENKTIGFAFNHQFQKVEENRQELVQKLVQQTPHYFVLVIGSVEDAVQKVVSFPWLFAFIAQNYAYLNNFGDIWLYHFKGAVEIPQKLVLEPNFAQNYKITVTEK